MDRKDILLAALSLSPSKSLTPVQVQKAMFLIAVETPKLAPSGFYSFSKYNYGPFSQDIYGDLNELARAEFLVVDNSTRVRTYRLTELGAQAALESVGKVNPGLAQYLSAVVQWVTRLSFPALVQAIYQKYPAYKENSIFAG
jgi:uncharacterized protein YwgA